ncbi:hypothetical protein [Gracilibacillus kekensis]|uniref:Uncharacterized protein n=1 Tax=Gracilibacillus kekensis TaxID=1027249 RepID=A0A1M7Q168_9BACI|nr:hypothetical protein [Gracilibacillus kekensis]SHN23920.1 hypothetical protein SAMN05216179_2723 [Gracilibacillus kekensis]
MLLQTKHLSMMGLGVKNHKDLVDGIHMRWSFNPELGFPRYGFRLYKGYPKEKMKESIPNSFFPVSEGEWVRYHNAADLTIRKNNLVIKYEESGGLSSEGVRLSREKPVDIILPEKSSKVALFIHWFPKKYILPIPIDELDMPVVELNEKLFQPQLNFNKRQVEKDDQDSVNFPEYKLGIDKRIKKTPIRPKLPQINNPNQDIPTIKIPDLKIPDIKIPDIPIIPKLPEIEQNLSLEIHINSDTDTEQIKTTTHPLKKGQNVVMIDACDLQHMEIKLKGSEQLEDQSRVLLSRIIWYPFSSEEKSHHWKKIGHYCLPIKHPTFPCTTNNSQSEWQIAQNRVKLKANRPRKYDRVTFEKEIRPDLEEIVKQFPIPQQNVVKTYPITESSTSATPPKPVELSLLQSSLLSAIQPEMAQILGLYGLDEDPSDDESIHYKIEGIWNKAGVGGYESDKEKLKDMYRLELDGLPKQPSFAFRKNGFHFASDTALVPTEIDGNHAIRVHGGIEITCPRPIAMVHFDIDPLLNNIPQVIIEKADHSMINHAYDKQLIMEDFDQGIVSINISGDFILHTCQYTDMNFGWISHDLRVQTDRDLPRPQQLETHALPGKGYVETEYGELFSRGTVGLKWDPPSCSVEHKSVNAGDNLQLLTVKLVEEDTPIVYRLQRASLGQNANRTPDDSDFKGINHNEPVLLTKKQKKPWESLTYPELWPTQTEEEHEQGWAPLFYIDAGNKDKIGQWLSFLENNHWYAYRALGIDLFGRMSEPSEPDKIQVKDELPPPPPMPVQAKYLHPKDEWLEPEEKQWINNDNQGEPGFRVKWRWLHTMQMQAPDMKRFRLYYKPGRWNLLEGKPLNVTEIDRDSSEITLLFEQPDLDGSVDLFKGFSLRQGGYNFKILSNTSSNSVMNEGQQCTEISFTVQHLQLPPQEMPDATEVVHIKVDDSLPIYKDAKQASVWVDNGGLISTISKTEGTSKQAVSANGDIKKWLEFEWFVKETDFPASMRLTPNAREPIVHGSFGITSLDDAGNESSVCPPLLVTALLRDEPPAPLVSDVQELWASYPDYYGCSYFKLSWSVPTGHEPYFHQVFRTVDEVLIMVDRDQHPQGHLYENGRLDMKAVHGLWQETSDEEGTHAYLVKQDLALLDQQISQWHQAPEETQQIMLKKLKQAYADIRNDTWQYIASLENNKKAYLTVTSPLDPMNNKYHNGSGGMMVNDEIIGKGRNQYFYRIATLDRAGNRGAWNSATPPVKVPDVMQPKSPVWTKVTGGQGKAYLRWRRNREKGMLHYEIYRTNRKISISDRQQMGTPIAVISADEPGVPLKAKVIRDQIWVDVVFAQPAITIQEVRAVQSANALPFPYSVTFAGFTTMIANLSIDKANVTVIYRDMAGQTQQRNARAFGNKVQLRIVDSDLPLQKVEGIYREDDHLYADNLFAGIVSGRIILQLDSEVDHDTKNESTTHKVSNVAVSTNLSILKNCNIAVEYLDLPGTVQTVSNVPHELEYSDSIQQSGTYYYQIVAVRRAIIGESPNGQEETLELVSDPAKQVQVHVLKEVEEWD